MDSKTLLIKQVRAHAQTMSELLSSQNGQAVDDAVMNRCLTGTRMLAGTTSMVGLNRWEDLLVSFESLLKRYRASNYPWGERAAGVISELIEKEETLVAAHAAHPENALEGAVADEEIDALKMEVTVAGDECLAHVSHAAMQPEEQPVDLYELGALAEPEYEPAAEPVAASAAPVAAAIDVPLDIPVEHTVGELVQRLQRLHAFFSSADWESRNWDSSTVAEISSELGLLQFYAQVVETIINITRTVGDSDPGYDISSLAAVMRDYAAELSHGTDRSVAVTVATGTDKMDLAMLALSTRALLSMVKDIADRNDRSAIAIQISASERDGAIRWRVVDDGENFISDSKLDNEDQLAFYPGLKMVVRTLGSCGGTLSVEPHDANGTRFQFTVPARIRPSAVRIWGESQQTFAVRTSQICELIPPVASNKSQDAYGDFVTVDGCRIPLIRLDSLYSEAPSGEGMIAVLGSVEKRVALFVPDEGTTKTGFIATDAIPVWRGASNDVALVEDQRLPLIDAGKILESYRKEVGSFGTGSIAGGVPEDVTETSERQATLVSNAPTPPDYLHEDVAVEVERQVAQAGTEPVEVLVVEQSQSMREALTGILGSQSVKVAFVGGVDEAMQILSLNQPQLIISEFRMPTMAAKRLVDTLRGSGKSIPVLVTTSQTGKTADMLVEKLGVAGYLSKPLSADEVSSQLSCFLGRSPAQ